MAPIKVTFKTVQGNKFELDLDSADKVCNASEASAALLHVCAYGMPARQHDQYFMHSSSADVQRRFKP